MGSHNNRGYLRAPVGLPSFAHVRVHTHKRFYSHLPWQRPEPDRLGRACGRWPHRNPVFLTELWGCDPWASAPLWKGRSLFPGQTPHLCTYGRQTSIIPSGGGIRVRFALLGQWLQGRFSLVKLGWLSMHLFPLGASSFHSCPQREEGCLILLFVFH